MKHILLLSIVSGLIFSNQALAGDVHSSTALCSETNEVSLESVVDTVKNLIVNNSEFYSLRTVKIEVRPVKKRSKETYFKTFFSIYSRLNLNEEPVYRIFLNEDINDCPPSEKAVEAILSHELFHIKDYAERSNWGLIELGIIALTQGPQYERWTDQRSLNIGYGEGLIDYRNWIYSVLPDEKALEKKMRYYLSPNEIRELMKLNQTDNFLP